MATSNSRPTSGTSKHSNVGNRRSGAVRGTRSGLRRGTLPWRKDPVILERVNLVRTLKAQGHVASTMLGPVNELMRRRGVPELVNVETLYDDFARLRVIQAEERAAAGDIEADLRERHIESLEEVKRQAWRAFHSASAASLNRSAYLNTIRATEETEAKLDGSLTQKVEMEATLRNGDRDLDAELERLLGERLARPRLVVEGSSEVEAAG